MNAFAASTEAWKSMNSIHGFQRLLRHPDGRTPCVNMEPSPGEEGFGRRAGSFDIRNTLLIPRDPRGIVLACGFAGLAALGADIFAVAGDWIGLGFLVTAVLGYLFIRTRLVPITVWALVAAYGVLAATSGNASDWLVVGLASLLTAVSLFPPVDWSEAPTSRKLEVRGSSVASPNQPTTSQAETSRNLEVSELAGPNDSRPRAATKEAIALSRSGRLSLRTIGNLQLEVDGRDQTQRIREQPRLEFLLSYLIARWVLTPGASFERSAIAAEIAPNIDLSSQLDRLRKTLHAFRGALGPDLKALVHTTSTHVRLDFTEFDLDFIALSEMAAKVDRRHGLIDVPLADAIRGLLEATASGEFLGDFTELEQQVTGGRGGAAELVEQARFKVDTWRADLAVALARHLEAAGRAQSSIAYLVSTHRQLPQREDVARLLVAAYMQTGQIARAEEVRDEYGFSLGEVK